jgi:hypothetical protein
MGKEKGFALSPIRAREVRRFLESSCGQPFDECRPADLVPVLAALLALVRGAPPCGAERGGWPAQSSDVAKTATAN